MALSYIIQFLTKRIKSLSPQNCHCSTVWGIRAFEFHIFFFTCQNIWQIYISIAIICCCPSIIYKKIFKISKIFDICWRYYWHLCLNNSKSFSNLYVRHVFKIRISKEDILNLEMNTALRMNSCRNFVTIVIFKNCNSLN